MAEFFTIGHSTRGLDELLALLRAQSIDLLVDVRTIPRSRRHPQFNQQGLAAALPAAGIAYQGAKALGGLRPDTKGVESPNTFWKAGGFRNFADYAMTTDFRSALAELEALAAGRRPAIMCAEASWRNCHRQIIADYLLAEGREVVHILGPGQSETARLTPAAVRAGNGVLLYPAPEKLADLRAPRLPGL